MSWRVQQANHFSTRKALSEESLENRAKSRKPKEVLWQPVENNRETMENKGMPREELLVKLLRKLLSHWEIETSGQI